MWKILQHGEADDFVLATGTSHSVREFAELAFKEVGIGLAWEGEGVEEKALDARTGRVLVEVDPNYFRPTEVDRLLGDASKAREVLNWQPRVSFEDLIQRMVVADLREAEKERLCQRAGF
jgi:GDPmannose 4,6-dehydratase